MALPPVSPSSNSPSGGHTSKVFTFAGAGAGGNSSSSSSSSSSSAADSKYGSSSEPTDPAMAGYCMRFKYGDAAIHKQVLDVVARVAAAKLSEADQLKVIIRCTALPVV